MKANYQALSGNESSVQIQTPFRTLRFVITTDASNITEALGDLANTTVEMVKQTLGGQKIILPANKLIHLLEISAADTGAIQAAEAANASVIRASITASDFGSLACSGNDFFKLTLKALPANYSVDVYAEDTFVDAQGVHNVYENISVDANSPRVTSIGNARWLALPVASISRLELTYGNGKVITHEAEEIRAIVCDVNEQSINANGVVTAGFKNFYVMNVADAVQAKITCTADATVIKVGYQAL